MKTILITAYAVNPYKGSEEGTGWNMITQVARRFQVIAITRKNNRPDIERYALEHPEAADWLNRITWLYFDWPKHLLFWKKGPLLSALYFYCWQLGVALWMWRRQPDCDVVHSLNFHSNWTPSFLWILRKPFIWGPVGNHPKIAHQYLLPVYGWRAFLKDRFLWWVKCFFWYLDPFVYICKHKADFICVVNAQSARVLRIPESKLVFMPAVASEEATSQRTEAGKKFQVLSVGRFVPLKGFDLTISAFAQFHRSLHPDEKAAASLTLIGTGPEKERLQQLIKKESMQAFIHIHEWMPRNEVMQQYQSASVFLFPSHEGAGMVVPEAMSYGIPVLCLDHYGPGEYIHPDSFLRIPHNHYHATIHQLGKRLHQLYRQPGFYQRESALAYERYDQCFRWSAKGDILESLYHQCHAPAFTRLFHQSSTWN